MHFSSVLFTLITGCMDPLMVVYKDDTGMPMDDTAKTDTADADTDTDVDSDTDADTDSDDTDKDSGDTSVPLDADGDGFTADVDCDDANALVHPEATEVCDGQDNDCDGTVDGSDSTDATVWYADMDGDGYGDAATGETSCGGDGYASDATDCDDTDALVHPEAVESDCTDPVDYNCDGTGGSTDGDGDGFPACQDCDDSDAAVNPDALEICDPSDVDEDCSGAADKYDPNVTDAIDAYVDTDGDGYGTGALVSACDLDGLSLIDGDCDDGDSNISPSASEICDSSDVDEDCDGTAEESGASGETDWHPDADADGYGDRDSYETACNVPAGYVIGAEDCDDDDPSVNEGATEYCDGVDNDCDYTIDEEDAADALAFYYDGDSDGYGDSVVMAMQCYAGGGYIADSTDCDDMDAARNPGVPEVCDHVDNDCDSAVDDGLTTATYYGDADLDGFGDAADAIVECALFAGYSENDDDCDDLDSFVGAPSVTAYTDADSDGYGDDSTVTVVCALSSGEVSTGGDCNDADASVTSNTWYADADADGYGDSAVTDSSCDDPSTTSDAYVSNDDDCDDLVAQAYLGATEVEDGVDNDCDGDVDRTDSDLGGDATGGNLFGDCASSGEEGGAACTTDVVEYATAYLGDQSGNGPSTLCGSDLTDAGLTAVAGDCALTFSVDATTGDWYSEQWTISTSTTVTAGSDVWCYANFGATRTNGTLHLYVINADTGSTIYPTSSSYENVNLIAPMWVTHELEFNVGSATNIALRAAMGDTSSSAYTWYMDGLVCQELL